MSALFLFLGRTPGPRFSVRTNTLSG